MVVNTKPPSPSEQGKKEEVKKFYCLCGVVYFDRHQTFFKKSSSSMSTALLCVEHVKQAHGLYRKFMALDMLEEDF